MRLFSILNGTYPVPFLPNEISKELALWIFTGILLITFSLFHAEWDIYISAYVFDVIKMRFPLHNHFWFNMLHEAARVLTICVIFFTLGTLSLQAAARKPTYNAYISKVPFKESLLSAAPKALIFIALLWIIAPGIIINSILKEHAGRARPHQITLFGGDKNFSPAFIISDQCDKNCSFSSGDPATGFALAGFAALNSKRRTQWLILSALAGTLFGITRIAQGKHFFFDIITTAYIVYGVYRLLFFIPAFRDLIPAKEEDPQLLSVQTT